MNIKTVNKAIAPMGDIVLHKGNGYFYFLGVNVDFSAGVYVNRLADLSLDEWIGEAKARLVAA